MPPNIAADLGVFPPDKFAVRDGYIYYNRGNYKVYQRGHKMLPLSNLRKGSSDCCFGDTLLIKRFFLAVIVMLVVFTV